MLLQYSQSKMSPSSRATLTKDTITNVKFTDILLIKVSSNLHSKICFWSHVVQVEIVYQACLGHNNYLYQSSTHCKKSYANNCWIILPWLSACVSIAYLVKHFWWHWSIWLWFNKVHTADWQEASRWYNMKHCR